MHYCHLYSYTVPPVVLNSPDNYTSLLRNPVTLQCLTAGYPPPEVTWLKNGAPLDPTDVRSVLCAFTVYDAAKVSTCIYSSLIMVTVVQCHISDSVSSAVKIQNDFISIY